MAQTCCRSRCADLEETALTTIVLLTEEALSADDAARIAALHPDEELGFRVLVPVDTERNLLVAVLDDLALGEFREALRERAHHDSAAAERDAQAALDATVSVLRGLGAVAEGALVGDDPVGALRAAAGDAGADEVVVVTEPHYVEETVNRDWASRAREHLGLPVLHLLAASGGRVA